jgi:hypothetical protein
MTMLFQCPDCLALHDEPTDAAFVLAVACRDCSLDAELRTLPPARTRPAMPAVAQAA